MPSAFTVRLDDDIVGALDRLAARTDRSRAWLVAQAVRDYVAVNAWQVEKIEQGIAAAQAGDFATDEEVARVRAKYGRDEA
jgi:predicted transcriptional regulator